MWRPGGRGGCDPTSPVRLPVLRAFERGGVGSRGPGGGGLPGLRSEGRG